MKEKQRALGNEIEQRFKEIVAIFIALFRGIHSQFQLIPIHFVSRSRSLHSILCTIFVPCEIT